MLLTITTTHRPATDLGYLLHKNPARVQSIELSAGKAHLFYSEATEERCTVAVMLEIDPVVLVRGRGHESGRFDQYVNDRPYAASSMLSSAITEFFSTAMGGRSKERPELAGTAIPLKAEIPVLPARGGEATIRSLFEPLGYEVRVTQLALDSEFPQWGEAPYFHVEIEQSVRLADLLNHLYVLIPVLDEKKHYYVGQDEVDKLLRRGGEWLAKHPKRDEITLRYMQRNRELTNEALARLIELDESVPEEVDADEPEEVPTPRVNLHNLRLDAVRDALRASGGSRVLDLGCGEGKLLALLLKEAQFREVVGMDVSLASLARAERKLHLDRMPERQAARLKLLHGSLVYRDRRLEGYDAAALVEVIEHLDAFRLGSMERVVFEFARPNTVAVTTPNREYNVLYESMPQERLRHSDHRFEWTRGEFADWANGVAGRHGYEVAISGIGPEDAERGAPSQMAVFRR